MNNVEIIFPGSKKSPFDEFQEWGYSSRQEYETQVARIENYVNEILSRHGDTLEATPLIRTTDVALMEMCLGINPQLSEEVRALIKNSYLSTLDPTQEPIPLELYIRVPLRVERWKVEGVVNKEAKIVRGRPHVVFKEKNGEVEFLNVSAYKDEKSPEDLADLEAALKQVAEMPISPDKIDGPAKQIE